MPKNFSFWPPNNAGAIIRLGIIFLGVLNLVALYLVIRPIGGSPEELRAQVLDSRVQLRQREGTVDRTRKLVSKIEAGRGEGDEFLQDNFLPRRTAYSSVITELNQDALQSNIKPKESSIAIEAIEGSDTLSMMQIAANFEGGYADLLHFINAIDRSENLLIIEGLGATPQQGNNTLNVQLKIDTFVREDGSGQ